MYVSSRQGYKPPVKSTGRGKKYSHFASLKYCNGAETFYTYDPQRRRLQNLMVNSGGNTIMDNAYTYDAVSNVLSVVNGASVPQSGKAGGQMAHTYTYDALYRLVSATGTYTGADNKTASYTLAMGYDNMHRITSKRQILTQNNVQFNGSLNAGYDLTYTYGTDAGKKFQLANVKDVNYRTEEAPSESENVNNNHAYEYDANGNLVYVNTSRTKKDGMADEKIAERKLKWDEENRLLASDDNGFVTNYWYDADGERTVKTSGESDQVYVNSEFAGGRTNTAKFSLYVSPYLVANQGGRYTKHIYIGSQRVVSKIGDFDSYGSDPRRIQYAGSETDGLSVDYKGKYTQQLQVIKDNYATFAVPYNGEDNNDYVDGKGFCCNDGSLEAAQARALSRAAKNNFQDPDAYEKMQFYYHPDHLGSSSYITNLDGEVVQHIEYVPFGEVFIEERNSVWNTPYLFNAKEFDEETGLYYYGARYYNPRLSIWLSNDSEEDKHPNSTTYCYAANNPIKFIDPDGNDIVIAGKENSSVTLITDLIDIRVNASALGINWGGNYVLQGEALLSATLDLVGIVDPSGVADGLNASLQAKNGDWGGTLISAAGLVPYVGDIAKVGKISKDVKIIKTAINSTKAPKSLSTLRKQAVRDAWKAEQQLVKKTGSGTRNWTKAEKAELLKTGKVKGYEGHHINNVKDHPEFAGNPNNIEFVKRPEHLDAHGGNFRNETHGELLNRNPNKD